MPRLACLATLLLGALAGSAAAAPSPLATVAEKSGFLRTGRYDEVQALCAKFQAAYPAAVRCLEFGRTPEGRPMLALVASRAGVLDAAGARQRELPVVLIQGGIHAGEIDGKDAGFLALRQILERKAAPGALDKQVLLFVPVFNVDGHERFGKWNRPNQRGPEQMGWRTTAQNYNLNRDYAKADSPEMQAMLALVGEWDPIATIDLHVTDGAKFEHDVSIQVEPLHAGNPGLRKAGTMLRDLVISDLRQSGSMPLEIYPSFVVNDEPSSGFADGVSAPRFSTGYFHLRNRFGMLVETHSWKDYPTRVRITRNTVVSVLRQLAEHGTEWLRLAHEADQWSSRLGGEDVDLDFLVSTKSRIVDFRGYAYTRTPSEVSGALMTRYDERKPQVWKIPLRYDIQATVTERAPLGGYIVPAAHAVLVGAKLSQHGVVFRTLGEARPGAAVETFRASTAVLETKSIEGHQRLKLEGRWQPEKRDIGAGSLFVPIAQPLARLAMALLEPRAPDSLAAWGEFNNAFEQKEYMEDYVAEDVARKQLAADPVLAAQFAARLRDDQAFTGNPAARLEFFARRHSSWDERYQLYPVYRTNSAPH